MSFNISIVCFVGPHKQILLGAGWRFVLRRGNTVTSLSVPGHRRISTCMPYIVYILRLQGLHLQNLRGYFPRVQQITLGGMCVTAAYGPISRSWCGECSEGFDMHLYFRSFLSDIRVCPSSSFASAT